jgi:hypothetical protein
MVLSVLSNFTYSSHCWLVVDWFEGERTGEVQVEA